MKLPQEVRKFCKYCNTYTIHKVKSQSKGKPRTLAKGNRKHNEKLKGHGGKRAGKVTVRKQGKRVVAVLTCSECNKKEQKSFRTRTKKKLEIKR